MPLAGSLSKTGMIEFYTEGEMKSALPVAEGEGVYNYK
jgi:hypothetical protein